MISAVACLCAARTAHAYRPFDGTDADVAETGELELEVGPLQGEHASGATTYTPGGVLNYGFASSYELVVDLDGLVPLGAAPGSAFVASDVLLKHVLREGSLQDKSGPSIALETGVLLPSLPRHGIDEAGWIATLIVSQRWSVAAVHLNATGMYQRDRQLGGFASAIVEGPSGRVRPVSEVLVANENGERYVSALAGAIWQKRKDLAFDGAVVGERDSGTTAIEVRIGFTWAVDL